MKRRAGEWLRSVWRDARHGGSISATRLLSPGSVLFGVVGTLRNRAYDWRILPSRRGSLPVVSVGNLTVGGTGKTPVTQWVVRRLQSAGRNPAIVLRGYGQDEILLHRAHLPDVPVIASRRRHRGVEAAAHAGCDCVVLDDGFQHRALDRELNIVLVAAEQFRAPHRLLPAGPWREPLTSLRRADFVIVTRKSADEREANAAVDRVSQYRSRDDIGVVHLQIAAIDPDVSARGGDAPLGSGRDILAVSSIGEPASFADQLRQRGLAVESLDFPDHHSYSETDLGQIARVAGGRPIVTTEKDEVKLRGKVDWPFAVAKLEVVMESGEQRLLKLLGRIGGPR